MTSKRIFAAASAAAALAAFPAAASAAPTVTVTAANQSIVVNGDGTDEAITVADNGAFITVDGNATTAPADNTFDLTVNGNGGADTLVVNTTAARTVTVNGGDGNDTITGSPENDILNGGNDLDTLNGAAGNDRISGNDANDTMNGDAGNDVLVWNPGDDDDVMNGGAGGGDDAELNGGNNNEQFSATPLANGRVKFERLNPVPFNLDVSADTERLVLNANGGADSMVSDPAVSKPMLLNGGTGIDTLTAGSGADLLTGGDDNDVLDGGPGDDRIVGDRGDDDTRGSDGDDTLVWNNGDGTDQNAGQNGLDTIEVNGSPTAGDVFVIKPVPGGTRFDRTNFGNFGLDITTSEILDVHGLGGDDSFTAQPGLPLAVEGHGEGGNDSLTGAGEPDAFFGGLGNDTLDPGAGPDLADGQDGDDTLRVRDNTGDLARGGAGTDSAQADRVDVLSDIESADVPPAIAPTVDVRTKKAKIRHKRVAIKLACAAGASADCTGRLTLITAKRYHGLRLVLGSARYRIDAGETKTIHVRVKTLAKKGKIAAIASTNDGDSRLTLKK